MRDNYMNGTQHIRGDLMYTFPTLKMMIGIPGSGKTTYCKEIISKYPNTIHISSDNIRKELFSDENDQEHNGLVFEEMHRRTLECLRKGTNVLYDATNMSRKNRASILQSCPAYVIKEAIVCWSSIEECIENDKQRERTVGIEVIDKMLKQFQAPYFDEGFNRIYIYRNCNTFDSSKYEELYLKQDISHDNPYHEFSIQDHMLEAEKHIRSMTLDPILQLAGRCHDTGKLYIKTFTNTKGENSDIAHYYGHQGYSGWISYGFICEDNIRLAWLVSNHMDPYFKSKYYNRLPEFLKEQIDILHEADVKAH